MSEARPFDISKHVVWEAYQGVKANRGAAGVDRQSLEAFEKDLKGNLYKIWNRMSSGSYLPPPVRLVEIPKGDGSKRPLGIPTVADRIAQTVARLYLEPWVDPKFHPDSYGSRRGKSAHDAVDVARKRSWRADWVVDLDVRAFFDNIDHSLILRAVRFHTDLKWLHLYIERWLKAPVVTEEGKVNERSKGSPQGAAISPLLANLFMHHAFDDWMRRHLPGVEFERYMDDVVIHCRSQGQAQHVLDLVKQRLQQCGLEVHPDKTRIVYCKDSNRRGRYTHTAFDFLGFTFRARRAVNSSGKRFMSFTPAVSRKSAGKMREVIRNWKLGATRNNQSLGDIARLINPVVSGWMNYYGRYYPSAMKSVLWHLERALVRWVQRKFKRFRQHTHRAMRWLGGVAKREPDLLILWRYGCKPAAGR